MAGAMIRAVILNDTRGDRHFGCDRVMRVIDENLARRGIVVIGRSLVRRDWERDAAFLARLAEADLIVINGEGTLHHGSKQAEKLLRVATHPARGSKPVALINTIFQDNPPRWKDYLDRIDIIGARDSKSAAAIRELTDRPVMVVPDLSLAEGALTPLTDVVRRGILVGDSVDRRTGQALRTLARQLPEAQFLPILRYLKPSKPHYPAPLWLAREAYLALHAAWNGWRDGNIVFNTNEAGFIRSLQGTRLHVTGRFHAICFCLFTRTPFLAVASNSWKTAELLADFGLGTDRIMTVGEIGEALAHGGDFDFSEEEHEKITAGLAMASERAADLFDRIAALAEGRP